MKKVVTISVLLALLSVGIVPLASAEPGTNRKAMFLSLLAPGLGQYYAGSPGYAKAFIAAELAIWGAYYYNTLMKDSKRQDYLAFAATHAGANPAGYGTSYLNAVGAFSSAFEYNGYQLTRESPVLYSGSMSWNWDSDPNRRRFKQLREDELDFENNLKYCIAGTVLNHLLAALHASKLSKSNSPEPALTMRVTGKGLAAIYSRSY
ncbi:MAG: hypothetical protein ACYC9O_04320 [Candidatus Latescibacterota bacterium]